MPSDSRRLDDPNGENDPRVRGMRAVQRKSKSFAPCSTSSQRWSDDEKERVVEALTSIWPEQFAGVKTGAGLLWAQLVAEAALTAVEPKAAQTLRLAQALRLIRDTSPGNTSNIARRALEEAAIPDPEDDGVF